MKNLYKVLFSTLFFATFGFGQPTMTIATTLAITPEVTTFAGSGSQGSADGTGTAATFYDPSGVAVDGSGNVYVGDTYNHLIRKITSAGVVTTLAGSGSSGSANGTGTAASFNNPFGVAVDGSGNVYVADKYNQLQIGAALIRADRYILSTSTDTDEFDVLLEQIQLIKPSCALLPGAAYWL